MQVKDIRYDTGHIGGPYALCHIYMVDRTGALVPR